MRNVLRAGLLAVCTALGFAAAPAQADIVLGHVVSLSGGQVATGRELSEGAQAYIDKVNAEGGVAGHKIVYLLRDDENLPELTLAKSAELLSQRKVFGLLPGSSPAHVQSLVSSGLLWQHSGVILSVRNGMDGTSLINAAEGSTREAGLIEIAPPMATYAPLLEEYRETLAKFGPPNAAYSSAGMQGYMAAKVMVNAVRMLSDKPTREEYRTVMLRMFPDLSNKLILTSAPQ